MISPRWRKVLADIWGNKTRTILVVLSIAVGVFAVGTIAGAQVVVSRDLRAGYVGANPAHAQIYPSDFDDDVLDMARSVKGVRAAEGRRNVQVRLQTGPDEWKNLRLTVIPNFSRMTINKVHPEGNVPWPPNNRTLVIERSSIGLTGANPGDLVTVEANGQHREMRIAGLAHFINAPPGKIGGDPFGFITWETAEWLGVPRLYNEMLITVADHPEEKEHIQEVAQRVRDKLEKADLPVAFVYVPTPYRHPADEIVQPMLLVLGVIGLLSLIASGFLVVNTIAAVLTQQIRQIGMMKAIGARTDQVMGMYFAMVLGYGVLSLCVGLPLGALGAYGFSTFMANIINFDIVSYAVPARVFVAELAVGLIVPILAALAPVISGARISVREAISDFGIGSTQQQGLLDRLIGAVPFLSRPTALSLRNTFRRKGRLALTLMTLTLGGTIFISVFTVRTSLFNTLDEALNYWKYDFDINFKNNYRVSEIIDEVKQVPGVVAAETWTGAGARRVRPNGGESQSLIMLGLPSDTQMIAPAMVEGRWLLSGDENALVVNTCITKDEPDMRPGLSVKLKIEGKELPFTVVGVVRCVMTGPIAYAHQPYLQEITGQVGRAGQVQVITAQHDAKSQAAIAKVVKEHVETIGLKVQNYQTIAAVRERIKYQFDLMVIFLLMMAVLLAIVGGLGLMGTMSINVLERTREIGVIRAIGASTPAVIRLFVLEGMLIGLLSWTLGAAVAIPASRLISDAFGMAMLKVPLTYEFSVGGALIWLAVALSVSALASILPAWRAARLTVRDVLSYQ